MADALAPVVKAIRAAIAALADPQRVAEIHRVVPGARTNGAPVPLLRALAKRVPSAKEAETFEKLCVLMGELCRTGFREEILVGTFIIGRHQRFVKTLPWRRVTGWLDAVDNWETCDQLSAEVLATMVNEQPSLEKELLSLARNTNEWRRRVAVATAASLNQRGRSQPKITAAVCEALAHDESPMIRKAVAWAGRELQKARGR